MPSLIGDRLFVGFLVRQEEVLHRLYCVFAEKIAAHRDFWFQLAQEEKQHARMLHDMADAIVAQDILMDGDRYEVSAIKEALDDLQHEVNTFDRDGITAAMAFRFAAGTEKQILERCFVDPFRFESALIRDTMRAMVMSIEDHLRRIQQEIARRPKRSFRNLFGLLGD